MTNWNIDLALPATQQRFAVDLFRAIHSDSANGNVVCSPFSVWCALLMAWMGARGETATALSAALHLDGLDRDRILRGLGPYIRRETRSQDGAAIEIANGIWINANGALGGVKVLQSYADQIDSVLSAKTASCDFNSSAAVDEINGWIRDRTKGRIDHLLDNSIAGTEALLINAASFDGNWAEPFDEELTTKQAFHCRDGRAVSTPLMRKAENMSYAESDRYQACHLSYGAGSGLKLYLLLPKTGVDLNVTTIADAEKASLDPFGPAFGCQEGTIWLPKFRSRQNADLSTSLATMGIAAAFDEAKADFGLMIEPGALPFFLSKVIHEATIDVDEEGTRAAAATAEWMAAGIDVEPPKPFEMRLDRPFLYAVIDVWPQTILFMGVLNDPTAN